MVRFSMLVTLIGLFSTGVIADIPCSYVDKLPEDASETQRQGALQACVSILEQKTLLLAAQQKYKEMSGELSHIRSGSNSSGDQTDEINIQKMLQSKDVFLLMSSGMAGKRTAKIFYQGSYYFLGEGEAFPGGILKSTDGNKAIIETGKMQRTIYLTTATEMRVALGISAPTQQRTKAIPLGAVNR